MTCANSRVSLANCSHCSEKSRHESSAENLSYHRSETIQAVLALGQPITDLATNSGPLDQHVHHGQDQPVEGYLTGVVEENPRDQ